MGLVISVTGCLRFLPTINVSLMLVSGMKKIVMIAAFAALAISCNNRLEFSDRVSEGGGKLDLSVWCVSPETRADQTKEGEDIYNENALTSIDYFIYPENSTLETPAVAHGRWTPETGTKFSSSKVVDMGTYQAQYGTKGYVFMLANVPADFVSGSESVNALLDLPVPVTTFGQVDQTGKFKPQDSFVMISKERVGFTLSNSEVVKVSVPLSRRAAKITLDIKMAKWFTEYRYTGGDKTHGTYVQTWYPNMESVQVYLLNYTDLGDMKGTPTSVSEVTKFASYRRTAYIPSIDEDGGSIVVDVTDGVTHEVAASKVSGNPFYSYPSKWESKDVYAPFIKVIVKWSSYHEDVLPTETQPGDKKSLIQANKEFYYKITIPDELDLKSNNWYKINLELSVLGGEADDAVVSIPGTYSVVAWSDPDEAMGGDLNSGRYLTVSGNKKQVKEGNIVYETFEAYGDKIDIPIITSHPFEVVNASSTYPTFIDPYTDGALTYSTDSSEEDNYTITPSQDMTYVSLEHIRVKGVNEQSYAAKDLAPITYTFKIQHEDADDYYRYIRVIQYPAIYADLIEGGDVFINGYFQYQSARPASGFSGLTERNYNFGNNYSKRGFRSDNAQNQSSTMTTVDYGGIAYDGKLPRKMTLITVTAFTNASQYYESLGDPQKTYIIGDPRQQNKTWNSLNRRVSSRNGDSYGYTNWSSDEISAIKVGTNIEGKENIIAPALLISSRWGRPGTGYPESLEIAEKRCATYQEAGYPAGRWRLPTEAEIYFIYTLQDKGLVDGLFSSDINSQNFGYYASSGRVFDRHRINQDGGEGYGGIAYANRFTPGPYSGKPVSVRCVYDYWYWEEQDKIQNTYNPKP